MVMCLAARLGQAAVAVSRCLARRCSRASRDSGRRRAVELAQLRLAPSPEPTEDDRTTGQVHLRGPVADVPSHGQALAAAEPGSCRPESIEALRVSPLWARSSLSYQQAIRLRPERLHHHARRHSKPRGHGTPGGKLWIGVDGHGRAPDALLLGRMSGSSGFGGRDSAVSSDDLANTVTGEAMSLSDHVEPLPAGIAHNHVLDSRARVHPTILLHVGVPSAPGRWNGSLVAGSRPTPTGGGEAAV